MSRVLISAFSIFFALLQLDPRQIVEEAQRRTTTQSQPYEGSIGSGVCWKVQSTPRQAKVSQYTHSYLWIRKDNYAFAQIDNYNKDQLVRRAHYSDIRNVQGIWTAHQIGMHDLKRNSHTILTIEKLQYNVPMKDDAFTREALSRES